jgi:hypothetical protein
MERSSGRKEILAFCHEVFGITSWQTVRAWKRRYGFPIRRLPNGRPFLLHDEAHKWSEEKSFISP